MTETIDCIERQIELLFRLKRRHVGHGGASFKTVASQSLIAKFNGFGVQVDAVDRVASLGQVEQKPSRPARGFEQLANLSRRKMLATLNDELQFRGTVGSEDEVVVFWMVVNRFDHGFDFSAQWISFYRMLSRPSSRRVKPI